MSDPGGFRKLNHLCRNHGSQQGVTHRSLLLVFIVYQENYSMTESNSTHTSCTIVTIVHRTNSTVAQRKHAGPITERAMDRIHPLLTWLFKLFLQQVKDNNSQIGIKKKFNFFSRSFLASEIWAFSFDVSSLWTIIHDGQRSKCLFVMYMMKSTDTDGDHKPPATLLQNPA